MGLYPNRLCTWGGGVGGLFLLMVMALLASPAAAQTWTGGGLDTNVSTPANWGGGILPSLTGGTSTLTFASSGTIATLNTPLDIMRLVFSAAPAAAGPVGSVPAATAFAINGGSTLTLRAETIGGGVTGLTAAPWSAVPTAVYRITTPVSLAASQVWAIENGSGPTFVVVDGAIGGSGSLEKRGSGTLVLTGSSIFAGNTSIAGGTLQFGNGGVAGSVSGPIVNNSTLAYGNGIGNAATVANLITGTGGLVVQGYGPVLLSNLANSFSGSITTSGQLIVANPAALGSGTSPILVTGRQSATPGGGLLRIVSPAAPAMLARDIALLPTSFTPSLFANLRVSGGISTIGDVTIAGAITTSPTFDASVGTSYGTLTLGGGIITQTGRSLVVGGLSTAAGFLANVNDPGAIVISGPITGGGGLVLARNTLMLTNTANAITGGVRLLGGRLRVASAAALGGNVFWNQFDGGGFEIRTTAAAAGDFASRSLSVNGGNNNSGAVFVDRAVGGSDIAATVVLGGLSLGTNLGDRHITFTGRNGYGLTAGTAGANLGYTGDRAVLADMNGLLTLHGNPTTAGNQAFSVQVTGDVLMTGTFLRNAAGAAGIAMAPGNAAQGFGTLTLTGSGSTITGNTTINKGTLAFRHPSVLPSGTILIGNASTTAGSLTFLGAEGTGSGGTLPNPLSLNTTTANVYLNASQAGTAPTRLLVTGPITAGGGVKTFVLGGSSTLDNEIQSVIPNNSGSNVTNLQKIGTGTWLLSGANTFTGTVTISGGELKLQGAAGRSLLPDAAPLIFGVDAFSNAAAGTLRFLGENNAASAETTGTLTPAAGAARIVTSGSGSGSAVLTLAALGNRTAGATVDFAPGAGGTIQFAEAPADTHGILGGWATFGGVDWVNSGTSVTPFAGYVTIEPSSDSATTNFRLTSGTVELSAATSVNSLKLAGSASTTALSLGGILANTTGGVLFDNSAGSAQITGSQLGAAGSEVIIATGGSGGSGDLFTVGSFVSDGSGSLTKSGPGTLVLTANNAYTGNTVINEGTVRLAGDTATLGGITTPANRTTIRQGGTLDINAAGVSATVTIGLLDGAGTITNSGASGAAAGTLQLGLGTTTTGTNAYFTGVIQNGAGRLGLTKAGATSSVQFLTGANTYTGPTRISSGMLAVTSLANIGEASGIGRGDNSSEATNAASLVFGGGVLQYTGANATVFQATQTPSVSTDRLFTLAGNGTIDSSGQRGSNVLAAGVQNNATLVFSNSGPIRFAGAGNRTLTLQGSSTGDNRINPQLVNNPEGGSLGVTKAGSGIWVLGNASNSYSGTTTISGGWLVVGDDSSDATRSLPLTSHLAINANPGGLQSTGTFSRPLGPGPGAVSFTTDGGFAAGDADLSVNIGGDNRQLTWGSSSFLTRNLYLNSPTSLGVVTLTNPIDLGGTQRSIFVVNNPDATTDYAVLSGVISGAAGITKTTNVVNTTTPALRLAGLNTFFGTTQILSGQVVVESLGGSGVAASNLGGPAAAVLLGPGSTFQGAALSYIGPGETSDRLIGINSMPNSNVAYAATIHSNGTGPLVLTNVVNNVSSANTKMLLLGGLYNGANDVKSTLADNGAALAVRIDTNGSWILSGSNSYSGGTVLEAGSTLGIGHDHALGGATGSLTSTVERAEVWLYAADGPRTVATPLNWHGSDNVGGRVVEVTGEHSLTFTGTYALGRQNNLPAGRLVNTMTSGSLVLAGPLDMSRAPTSQTFFIGGPGPTVISGEFLPAAGKAFVMNYEGTGTLTLSGSNLGNGHSTTANGLGAIIFTNPNAISGTGANITINANATVAAGYAIDQEFLGRVVNTSGGVVALALDSANDLNFSGTATGGVNLTAASLGAVGNVTYSGSLAPNASTYRLGGGGGTLTVTGQLTGNNTLVAGGAVSGAGGVLRLTNAASNYTGKTSIFAGTLEIGAISDVGSASPLGAPTTAPNGRLDIGSGTGSATLRYTGGGHATDRAVYLAGTTGGATLDASGSGAIEFTTAITAANGDKTLTLTGSGTAANAIASLANPTTGVTSLVKTGPGRWVLTAASSYTGRTSILGGTLVAAVNAPDSGPGAFGTIDAAIPTVGDTTAGTGGFAALLLAEGVEAQVPLQVVARGAGATQVAILGGSGTSGIAMFGESAGISVERDVTLQAAPGGRVDFANQWFTDDFQNLGAGSRAFTIGGTGMTGRVRIASPLATTGNVTVAAGTLDVASVLGGGGDALVVMGGILSGTGTINKDVILAAGGTLAPGNSPGTLTIGGDLTMQADSFSTFELDTDQLYDRLIADNVTFGGTLDVVLLGEGPAFAVDQIFDLFDWTDTASGSFSQINLPALSGGLQWKTFEDGSQFDYTTGQIVVVVPEPATLVLVIGGIAAALLGVRRWR